MKRVPDKSTRKTCKIMKVDRADDNRVIVFGQSAIKLNGNSVGRFTQTNKLHQISRVVSKSFYSLRDKRRENFIYFFFR